MYAAWKGDAARIRVLLLAIVNSAPHRMSSPGKIKRGRLNVVRARETQEYLNYVVNLRTIVSYSCSHSLLSHYIT